MVTHVITDPPSIGSNVREARQAHQYAQCDLAQLTGLSRAYIGRIETGKQIPSLSALFILADALHTSASALLGGVASLPERN